MLFPEVFLFQGVPPSLRPATAVVVFSFVCVCVLFVCSVCVFVYLFVFVWWWYVGRPSGQDGHFVVP